MDGWLVVYGIVGSVAVEIVQLSVLYETGRPLPPRYRRFGFYVVRAVLALMAGILVLAYSANQPVTPILAFHIGAATPAIVGSFARTPPGPPAPAGLGDSPE
jgi:hypothetical protein